LGPGDRTDDFAEQSRAVSAGGAGVKENVKGGLIFVSCGQVSAGEKKLGQQVCQLVRELTPHRPYFAENQNSLDAFTKNILGSLDDAVALVAIMHPRGTVKFPDGTEHIRASAWIEQEVAIAAFITQILGRPLRIAPYIHADIRREGMREQLQLNAVQFREDDEVLEHLRSLLPSWRDLPASLKVTGAPKVRVTLKRGHPSNFLLQFTNDSDEEALILEVKLEHKGVELTDPLVPESSGLWSVPPHSSRSFGKTIAHQRSPAASLLRMHPNEGLFFHTEVDVVFTGSVRGRSFEICQKLYGRVNVPSNEIVPLV